MLERSLESNFLFESVDEALVDQLLDGVLHALNHECIHFVLGIVVAQVAHTCHRDVMLADDLHDVMLFVVSNVAVPCEVLALWHLWLSSWILFILIRVKASIHQYIVDPFPQLLWNAIIWISFVNS